MAICNVKLPEGWPRFGENGLMGNFFGPFRAIPVGHAGGFHGTLRYCPRELNRKCGLDEEMSLGFMIDIGPFFDFH